MRITSEEVIPEKASIESVIVMDTTLSKNTTFKGNTYYDFSGTLVIKTLKKQYLRIQLLMPNDYFADIWGQTTNKFYNSKLELKQLDQDEFNLYNGEFFSVDDISKSYRFKFTGRSLLNLSRLNYILIKISSVSNTLFKYAQQTHEIKKNGNSPFVEPINISTNIENGYGIFGFQHSIIDTFKIR